jgi:hypothetical protein
MSTPGSARPKDACPHCGRTVGLTLFELLPSSNNKRALICRSCGGKFDLSNGSKMAAVVTGMVGMVLGTLVPFPYIVKLGNGSKLSIISGIIAVGLSIVGAAMAAAWLTLSLERK